MCTYARIELFPTLFNTQGPAISAAGCLVGDEGGRVIQLVVKKNIGDSSGENNEDDDCLEEQDPYFGQQLNRNKERVVVQAEAVGEGVLALLQALYEQHDQANIVFATNWDEARVDAAGLAFDTLHQQYPRLVYVKSVLMMHVGCTRCVTSNTDHNLKIRARMGVDLIRACMFLFFLYV
jgi:crotonobetainyl-CoA:carnitine CoA-transferase CaiB-like acyl-CoA transferase